MCRRYALFLSLLFVAACRRGESAPSVSSEVSVTTVPVVAEDVDVTLRAVGTLRADQSIAIKPKRAGHVRELHLIEGARVEAGDVLVRLDNDALQARLDVGRANVTDAQVRERNARRQFERSNALLKKGVASEQQTDNARAELDRAVAALGVAQANLAFAEAEMAESIVQAPFGGILGQRRIDLGAFVREGETLVTLVDLDPMELVFAVPERHLGQIQAGQQVEAAVVSHDGGSFPGTVKFIDPEVDPVNRTVAVKAIIDNPDHLLRPGQFATVTLHLDRHPGAAVVPEEALVPDGDRNFVFVVADGRANGRAVQTGVRLLGRVEIIDGLRVGERVVNAGHEKLAFGAATAVTDVTPAHDG